MRVTVRVPATSANLGAGFDCLGLALALYNEITLDLDAPPGITITGEGARTLPRDERNLAHRTVRRFFQEIGRPLPAFALHLHNRIPLTGGLGSSSATLVGALLAANAVAGQPCSTMDLLTLAYQLEGHPDNVAPALLGGCVLVVVDDGRPVPVPIPLPPGLRAVIFCPNFTIPTREARALLPSAVPYRDAVFNLGRAALFVAACTTGRLDLLRLATQDALHQPYRQKLFPTMPRFFEAALAAGALGVWLSGAGSALLALTTTETAPVAAAFEHTAAATGTPGRVIVTEISPTGAEVLAEAVSDVRPAGAQP